MVEKSITGVVTWLKNWFYDKEEITGYLNNKVNLNQGSGSANMNVVTGSSGNITVEAKPTIDSALSSSSTNAVQNKVINTALNGKANSSHNQATTTVTNTQAYNHIKSGESTTLTLTNQKLINDAINTKIGELESIEIIIVTSDKGTASASTMNRLFIELRENNSADVYYTIRSGTSPNYTYAWHLLDADILNSLSLNFTADQIDYDNAQTVKDVLDDCINYGGDRKDDIDWSYNSNDFVNGIKLVPKATDSTGCIIFHLK